MQTQDTKSNGQLNSSEEKSVATMEVSEETAAISDNFPFSEESEEATEETPKAELVSNQKIIAPYKAPKTDFFMPKFTQLRLLPEFNIREDYGDIEELAENIKANGIKVPLIGYRDKDEQGNEIYIVVHGHRRHAACKLLYERDGIEITVKFMLESKGTNPEQRLIETFITNDGKSMTELEWAEGVRRLIAQHQWTVKQVADRLGKKEGAVRNLEKLANAPMALKNLLKVGAITYSAVLDAINQNVVEAVLDMHKERSTETAINEDGTFDHQSAFALNTGDSGAPVDLTYKKADKKKSTKISAADVAAAAGKVNSYKELKVFMESADTDGFTEAGLEVYKLLDRLIRNDLTVKKLQIWFKNKI